MRSPYALRRGIAGSYILALLAWTAAGVLPSGARPDDLFGSTLPSVGAGSPGSRRVAAGPEGGRRPPSGPALRW
jgi:hypothetical protein